MIFNMQLSEDASLAELSDIRVGVDGTVYPSAGDAVRGQITDVEEDFIPFPVSPDSKYGNAGQLLRTKGTGNTEWSDYGLPTDEQTAQAITDWLDAHPEATTTVQDNSLTYNKLVNGTLGFVTPKMFGAAGDGVTDDTAALKSCLLTELPVNLEGLSYSCGLSDTFSNVKMFNGTLISSHVITITGEIDIDIDIIANSANGIVLDSATGKITLRSTRADASLLILKDSHDLDIDVTASNVANTPIMLNENNHNLDIVANLVNVGASGYPGIYVNSGATAAERNTCISIRNTTIKNCGYMGILLSGEQVSIEDSIIDTCTNNGSCIWIHDASNVTVKNCVCSNAQRNGIYSNKSNHILIQNCEAYNNNYCGIMLAYDSNTTPYYSGLTAHNVANVVGGYYHDNNIASAYSDVRIDGWKNVTFVGCKVGTKRVVIASNNANENISFINCSCDAAFFAGLTDTIAACLGIVDVFDTAGHKMSFNGKAPVVNTTYTLGTYTVSRYLSYASSTTVETVTNVLATLIKDLKDKGFIN